MVRLLLGIYLFGVLFFPDSSCVVFFTYWLLRVFRVALGDVKRCLYVSSGYYF